MQRRRWTMAETEFLLERYLARIGEMQPRKKNAALRNIALDLTESAIVRQPVTPGEVQNKIKSLIRYYKERLKGFATSPIKPGHRFFISIKKIIDSPTLPVHARTKAALLKLDQNNDLLSPLYSVEESSELFKYENTQEEYKESKVKTILPDLPEPSLEQKYEVNEQVSKEFKRENNLTINKFSEKKKWIEYKENRKDKRLKMKLDFLKYKKQYNQKFYDEKLRFYSESIEILREIKDIVKIAFNKGM